MTSAHVIEELGFDIDFASEDEAFEAQERLMRFAQVRAQQVIAEVFDQAIEPDAILRLEKLEVDIGTVAAVDFEDRFAERLRDELQALLRDRRAELELSGELEQAVGPGRSVSLEPSSAERHALEIHSRPPEPGDHSRSESPSVDHLTTGARAEFDWLLYYIEHGCLPWHAPADIGRDMHALAARVLEGNGVQLAQALRVAPISQWRTIFRRLTTQFPTEWLAGLGRQIGLVKRLPSYEALTRSRARAGIEAALGESPESDDLREIPRDLHDTPDALHEPVVRSRTRVEIEVALGESPESDCAFVASAQVSADTWRCVLRDDSAWLEATLLRLGRAVRVRRRLVAALPEEVIPDVLALWLSPTQVDTVIAALGALEPLTRAAESSTDVPRDAISGAGLLATLTYIFLEGGASNFSESAYRRSLASQTGYDRTEVLNRDEVFASPIPGLQPSADLRRADLADKTRGSPPEPPSSVEPHDRMEGPPQPLRAPISPQEAARAGSPENHFTGGASFADHAATDAAARALALSNSSAADQDAHPHVQLLSGATTSSDARLEILPAAQSGTDLTAAVTSDSVARAPTRSEILSESEPAVPAAHFRANSEPIEVAEFSPRKSTASPIPRPTTTDVPSDLHETPSDLHETPSDLRETPSDLREVPSDLRETPSDLREVPSDLRETPSDLREVPRDLHDTPDALHEPVVRSRTRAEIEAVLGESPESDFALVASAQVAADTWRSVLRDDSAWLKATLLRLGRAVRVRRRLVAVLPAEVIPDVLSLWLSPTQVDSVVAALGALEPLTRAAESNTDVPREAISATGLLAALTYILVEGGAWEFNESDYRRSLANHTVYDRTEVLDRDEISASPIPGLQPSADLRRADLADKTRGSPPEPRSSVEPHDRMEGPPQPLRAPISPQEAARAGSLENDFVGGESFADHPATDAATQAFALSNSVEAADEDARPAVQLFSSTTTTSDARLERPPTVRPDTDLTAAAMSDSVARARTHSEVLSESEPALHAGGNADDAPPAVLTPAPPGSPPANLTILADSTPSATFAAGANPAPCDIDLLYYLHGISTPNSPTNALRGTLQALLDQRSPAARQALISALEYPRAAHRLAALLADGDLRGVLKWLRPTDGAMALAVAARVTKLVQRAGDPSVPRQDEARSSLSPPVDHIDCGKHTTTDTELLTRAANEFLLTELFEEGRALDPEPFVSRLTAALRDALASQAETESAIPEQGHSTHVRRTSARADADSSPLQTASPAEDDVVTQRIYIANAGVVIVGPYLPNLFSMLGLTSKGAFATLSAAHRAVHLIQYLVTGATVTPEPILVLNKVLCGLPVTAPVPLEIDLRAQERTAIEDMLTAIIAHWKAIGRTSIAGLRESFLQRDGRLIFSDDAWRLRVESRCFDMLLDRLPWGYATVKYPWMKQVLHVDWR